MQVQLIRFANSRRFLWQFHDTFFDRILDGDRLSKAAAQKKPALWGSDALILLFLCADRAGGCAYRFRARP